MAPAAKNLTGTIDWVDPSLTSAHSVTCPVTVKVAATIQLG